MSFQTTTQESVPEAEAPQGVIDVSDFVNPKSMLTPGIAGSMSAMIAASVVTLPLNLKPPVIILLVSCFVGVVVHNMSKAHFNRWGTKRSSQVVFYVLNSLLIFAAATGAIALSPGDPEEGVQGPGA